MPVIALPSARGDRKLASWIAGFLEYTEKLWSTETFRKWAAITAIAGALERKVWVRSQSANIFPNLYVFLVGPPGAGKTRAVEVTGDLWKALEDHKVAPVSLTKASLMDEVGAAERTCHQLPLGQTSFNSLLIASKELGALIPGYDSDFLNALTYLYDNAKYDEKRRGNKDPLVIERPQINLIGCTTPGFLLDTMPIGAWSQGFLSRVILVYSDIVGERKLNLMEEELPRNRALEEALKHDLRLIGATVGKLAFTQEANDLLVRWSENVERAPSHPRLQNYVTRRPIHAVKLCMIACADRGGDQIEIEDAQSSIDWLMEAEKMMPDLFLAMATGGDASVISEAHHYAITLYTRGQASFPVNMLYEFLGNRLPAYRVQPVLDLMFRSKMLNSEVISGVTMVTPRGTKSL
jgi:hypothetical protein